MTWNQSNIIKLINESKTQFEKETSTYKKFLLLNDYNMLTFLLDEARDYRETRHIYVSGDFLKTYNLYDDLFRFINNSVTKKNQENYEKRKKLWIQVADCSDRTFLEQPGLLGRIQMLCPNAELLDPATYFELIYKYYTHYAVRDKRAFNEIKDGYLWFSEPQKRDVGSLGYTIVLSASPHAFVKVKSPYKNITTLPHEIAHVSEYKEITDPLKSLCWNFYALRETYSKLSELQFISFLNDYGYHKLSINQRFLQLDAVKIMAEKHLDNLNEGNARNTNELISSVLSFYFMHLYKYDKEKYDEKMKLYAQKRNNFDDSIWDIFDENDIFDFFQKELEEYNKEAKDSKRILTRL